MMLIVGMSTYQVPLSCMTNRNEISPGDHSTPLFFWGRLTLCLKAIVVILVIYFQGSVHADSPDITRVVATPEQTPDASTKSHSNRMNTPDKTLSELGEQSINETVESQPPSVEEEPTGTIHTAHLRV